MWVNDLLIINFKKKSLTPLGGNIFKSFNKTFERLRWKSKLYYFIFILKNFSFIEV